MSTIENKDRKPSSPEHDLEYTCPVDHEGSSVFVKGWIGSNKQHPPLILIHNIGEEADRFTLFAHELRCLGFRVYAYDLRGHGQSEPIWSVYNFQQLVADLLQVVAWVRHQEGGKKPIIIGEGIGALISVFFAHKFSKFSSGYVLANPYLDLAEDINPARRFLVKRLAEIFPKTILPSWICSEISNKIPSRNSLVKSKTRISTAFFEDVLNASTLTLSLISEISQPLLIFTREDNLDDFHEIKKRAPQHFQLQSIKCLHDHFLTEEPDMITNLKDLVYQWIKNFSSQQKSLENISMS